MPIRTTIMVVIAASAGGVTALGEVLGALPADFPIPIAVVQHRTGKDPYQLAKVLGRRTPLTVKNAENGEQMRPGTVYLAPADLHLLIGRNGLCTLSDGRKIRHVRSSADPLFTSAAGAFGNVIAVVLTGGDGDASDGVQSVSAQGGIVIAQDPETSEAPGMPQSAIDTGCVDRVLPLGEIGPALVRLVETGSL